MAYALPILNLLFFLATIILNGLSNGRLVPGKTIGSVSDKFETLFTPAGITFAIWGLIYLGLGAFAVYQMRDLFMREKPDMEFRSKIGVWFIVASVANGLWLLAWLQERLAVSMLLMLALLGSLLIIYLNLQIGVRQVSPALRWFVHIPFRIYIAWICVATIANARATLISLQWEGWGLDPYTWTYIMIAIAGILGAVISASRSDLAFGGVILWALLGIWLKHGEIPDPKSSLVRQIVIGAMILVLAGMSLPLIKYFRQR